jgi:hypothetical protein
MRIKSLENIINIDLVISRCNRRESSFTADECKLLIAAVVNYRGILPQSSRNALTAIPLLLEKLAAIIMTVYSDKEPSVYSNTNKVTQAQKAVTCTYN